MTDTIYLEDRSGAELDDKCARAWWWNRFYAGKGIVPRDEPEALNVGRLIHEDFAAIAEAPDHDLTPDALRAKVTAITDLIDDSTKLYRHQMELLYRRLGWLVAWAVYKEPFLRHDWENVSVERDIILDRTPLWVPTTPDRILRHRRNRDVIKYVELKSTISASQKWLDSWRYKIQLHIGIKAASEELGETVRFGQIIGLMKGSQTYGDDTRLAHPYAWGYRSTRTGAWTYDYNKARSSEWIPAPVWDYEPGIVSWVTDVCGAEVAASQFPTTAPVFLNEAVLNEWIERRLNRQTVVQAARVQCNGDKILKNLVFPRKLDSCRPPFGDPCPYVAACWNAQTESDPLQFGDYVVREPHHAVESVGVV